MPEAATSTVAVLPALSGNPLMLIVKIADAPPPSLIVSTFAAMLKLIASGRIRTPKKSVQTGGTPPIV